MKCIAEAKIAFNRYACVILNFEGPFQLSNVIRYQPQNHRFMQCNFRLQSFLELPEYSHPKQDDNGYPPGSVEIANASMAWEIITQGKNNGRKTEIGNL